MITAFFLILPGQGQGTSETSSLLNLHNPYYAAYLALFVTTAAVGQIATLRGSLCYAKVAQDLWLRRSMWTVAAGALLILTYCILRWIQILGVQAGGDMTSWNPVQWMAGDTGSLLELLGWTAPGWGPWLSARGQWIRKIHYYHRLHPLWFALYDAAPEIALHPPRSRLADVIWPGDIDYRLYRRLIEILDGQLALRAYSIPPLRRPPYGRSRIPASPVTNSKQRYWQFNLMRHSGPKQTTHRAKRELKGKHPWRQPRRRN